MQKVTFALTVALAVSVFTSAAPAVALPAQEQVAPSVAAKPLPLHINGGTWKSGHLQGVAVDRKNGFVYWSFTQSLVKTDLNGKVIGTVEGLIGHLGDLALNPKDGRVYGSLEFKDDVGFYIAIFDVKKINRIGMNVQTSGVMTAVYLDEVVKDYTADMNGDGVFDGDTADTPDHRYGCSGIDGVSFGPPFGTKRGPLKIMVAYGIYSNVKRTDNDYQVILQYDLAQLRRYEKPLNQTNLHHSGPKGYEGKFFVYTGNTNFGVQNLEYDPYTGYWMMAVYKGKKPQFPNYSFFTVDGSIAPVLGELKGQPEPEEGKLLTLRQAGIYDKVTGIWGWDFNAAYGLDAFGNGRYYVGETKGVTQKGVTKYQGGLNLYRWTGDVPAPFTRVTADAAE